MGKNATYNKWNTENVKKKKNQPEYWVISDH